MKKKGILNDENYTIILCGGLEARWIETLGGKIVGCRGETGKMGQQNNNNTKRGEGV